MCWVEVCINAYFQHILFKYILDKVYRKAAPREPEQILAKKIEKTKNFSQKRVTRKKKLKNPLPH